MQFTTRLTTLSLLPLISALPAILPRADFPPLSTTTNYAFTLVANVTGTDLSPSIKNYVLNSYHTGAGLAYAVLTPPSNSTARVFYINGTASEVAYGTSSLLSDAGTLNATFPEGLIVSPQNPNDASAGASTVEINSGEGQEDVGLTIFSPGNEIVHLHGLDGEGFYACETTLEYGPAIQLWYKSYSAETPAGCADIDLLPQCAGGSGIHYDTAFGKNVVSCYDDVSAIDWSLY